MTRKLYELTAADDTRQFSPYCWRIRLALAHKGLEVETIPWRFTEKEAIAFSGQARVPVLVDGEQTVVDSWAIATYLDETYPDHPLLASDEAKALALFIKHWDEKVLTAALVPLVVFDIFKHLHERDQAYFRTTREAMIGKALEDACGDRPERLQSLRKTLTPVRETVAAQPFLGGTQPNFADHIVMGRLMLARSMSPCQLLDADDPVYIWRDRLLDQYNGMARNAPGYDH